MARQSGLPKDLFANMVEGQRWRGIGSYPAYDKVGRWGGEAESELVKHDR